MAVQFQSSMGKTYFVRQALTKTGKVTYVCTTTPSEVNLEELPAGMEFRESIRGKVTVGKKVVSKITDKECQYVLKTAARLAKPSGVKVELKKAAMVIYEVVKPELPFFLKVAVAANPKAKLPKDLVKPIITPSLRVTLVDDKTRRFTIERISYSGTDELWLFLDKDDLKTLIQRYAPHIGKDSMFQFF